ncbi:hypothetical protein [Actinomyces sp. ZJ308]|uniref:hypothetical protein n=1 Tax=Actinomyces sp. ZJ308 TaxID=2708342 RepID=UPI001AB03B95|nr:hypothetical protein [Actinomyces sp. ZJ308]
MGGQLGLRLGPATLVDCEPALDLLEDVVGDEAGHTVLDDMLPEGVLTDVDAVLQELVQVLGCELVPTDRADTLGVQAIRDLLH